MQLGLISAFQVFTFRVVLKHKNQPWFMPRTFYYVDCIVLSLTHRTLTFNWPFKIWSHYDLALLKYLLGLVH